jgi:hypothetical protein
MTHTPRLSNASTDRCCVDPGRGHVRTSISVCSHCTLPARRSRNHIRVVVCSNRTRAVQGVSYIVLQWRVDFDRRHSVCYHCRLKDVVMVLSVDASVIKDLAMVLCCCIVGVWVKKNSTVVGTHDFDMYKIVGSTRTCKLTTSRSTIC